MILHHQGCRIMLAPYKGGSVPGLAPVRVGAAQAKRLADELSPVVVVPMHYRQGGVGYDVIGTVEQFTKLCDDVAACPGSELGLTPQISRQTAVLKPQNA